MKGACWVLVLVGASGCFGPETGFEDMGVRHARLVDLPPPGPVWDGQVLRVEGYASVPGADKSEFSHVEDEIVPGGIDLRLYARGDRWIGSFPVPPTDVTCDFDWVGHADGSGDSLQLTFVQPDGRRETWILYAPGGTP